MAEADRRRNGGDDDVIGPEPTAERPTVPVPEIPEGVPGTTVDRSVAVRLFGSTAFFRLWVAQVVSALGDWIGFFAIVVLAARIGGGTSPEAAISLVMTARILPGFFLAPVAGVLADRWDRKRVMVACDVGRGLVFATLPFIGSLWLLVVASFLLEVLTLLWQPAKEASVPHLVPRQHLATANSLSLTAAYGTLPLAGALFAVLVKVGERLGGIDGLEVLQIRDETVAIWFNVVTFFAAALLISTIPLPAQRKRAKRAGRVDLLGTFHELKEGWRFIFISPVVRSVMVGLGTGLIGGGMLVPLGPVFTEVVLGAGSAGFGVLLAALGGGVGVGVVTVSALQNHLPKSKVFSFAVLVAGAALLLAASVSSLTPAAVLVVVVGACAGAVYVLGFTILHESVDDELRGRIFGALYTLVRLCVLISFAVGPLLAGVLDGASARYLGREITVGTVSIALPGVRLALWLAAVIIIVAGVLAVLAVRLGPNGHRHASAPEETS